MKLPLCLLSVLLLCASSGHAQEKPVRLLFVGNSITLHGPAENIGWTGNWGMAASAADKDYVHLVVDAVAKQHGRPPEFRVVNIADFERAYQTFDLGPKLHDALAFRPDTVIVAIGENVPALATDEARAKFQQSVVRLLTLVKGDGQTTLVLRSCFWADPAKDTALKAACAAVGGLFVDIGPFGKDEANFARSERPIAHAGVAAHPGDRGMRVIAGAITAALLHVERGCAAPEAAQLSSQWASLRLVCHLAKPTRP